MRPTQPPRPAADAPRTRPVIGFSATLAAAGIALGATAAGLAGSPSNPPAALLPIACAVLAAAAYLIVRFQYREDADAIDLFEATLAPVLFVVPGPVAVGLAGAAILIANIARRNQPVKATFNVAQWMSATGAGALVLALLRRGDGLSLRNTGALLAALLAVTLVNQLAFATVLSIARGERFTAVMRGLAPVILPGWVAGWAVNASVGILFAAAAVWTPWAMVLAFVPLIILHSAYRGHASALADRTRLAGLQRATHVLAQPVDPSEALPQFLTEVLRCFEARAADLVLVTGEGRLVHRVRAGQPRVVETTVQSWSEDTLAATLLAHGRSAHVDASGSDPVASGLAQLEGWRDCIAAPLVEEERTLGILCVYDRGGLQGFEEGERVVLDALASEAARALAKSGLLSTILEERRKLSDIVERASDGIMTLGPGGTVKTWNPALERITGFGVDEMVGTRLLEELQPRDAAGHEVAIQFWADSPMNPPADIQIRNRAGEERWLSCSYTRVADGEGRPSMLIVVARDATEAHETERLKDDFVATVSHELRTPLTPIKGWAVTLLQLGDHLDNTQRREGIQAILRHAERLERLITNILEVSKIERGLGESKQAHVDVRAVVEKVVSDFRTEHAARTITIDIPSGSYATRGDEIWIEQIVANLLSNAMKYSPADQPVDVALRDGTGRIEVSVTDRGPGIPPSETERIFERFKRLGDHMTRSVGGTGLGLYIARQLARAIGGELSVATTPGKGATFTLSLEHEEELAPVA